MEIETSLAVQLLRLSASSARGIVSIPDWGPMIPHTAGQPKKCFFFLKYRNRLI